MGEEELGRTLAVPWIVVNEAYLVKEPSPMSLGEAAGPALTLPCPHPPAPSASTLSLAKNLMLNS